MKNIIIITIALLMTPIAKAQVLYTENFDNFSIGNLGTNFTGAIPGQGGWITQRLDPTILPNNNCATIIAETGKGKALKLSNGTPLLDNLKNSIYQPDINTLIDHRTVGNNVIAFEFDFFTGPKISKDVHNANSIRFQIGYNDIFHANHQLVHFDFYPVNGWLTEGCLQIGVFKVLSSSKNTTEMRFLPSDTWFTIKIYIDFNAKKVYYVMPYFTAVADFLKNETGTNLIEKYKPKNLNFLLFASFLSQNINVEEVSSRVDNIKITALQSVPPEVLTTENYLAEKFNLYPNPATNVVNITSNENMVVQQVAVYDTTGKLISTQNFSEQAKIQLNVEHLASGTYLLHLQTAQGIAVKKMVKK